MSPITVMVEKLIYYFEDLNLSMDKKRPSLRSVSKGRVKKLVHEFTEIKRPPGKNRTIAEHSEPSNRERGTTLPRGSKVTATEFSKISEKVTRQSSYKEERTKISTNSIKKEKKTDVNSSPNFTFYDHSPDVKEKLDEFVEKLKQKRLQSQSEESKNKIPLEIPTDKTDVFSVSERITELVDNEKESKHTQEKAEKYGNMCQISQDETDSFLDGSDSDDIFGLNGFDEESEDNYIVEARNEPGNELIITTLQITHRSISPGKNSYELLLENAFDNLAIDENEVNYYNDPKKETDNSVYHYENYEQILSVHIEDNDDVFIDNQIHNSSESDIYEEVDDYINMDAVTTNAKTLEINNNSEESDHLRQPISRDLEQKDNYYYNDLPDTSDEDANDGQSPNVEAISNATNLERKEKINYVIEELIKTEELYLGSLRKVVEKYEPYLKKHTPPDLIGKTQYIFGNITAIYEEAQRFYKLLKHCNKTADEVAKVFIQSTQIFELYPHYSKNKPTADIYLKEFDEVVKRRQKQLGDKLGLASHLLTPIQRLGKYILMLENIQKELVKECKPLGSVNEAINIIRNVMRKGNDSIAIDSIKNCSIDLMLQGSFIMRASFNILKPKKFTAMVFLFDKVIVFTQKSAKNMEQFNYVDSIQMSDLILAKFEGKPCIFHLIDYPKMKKAINHDAVTYVLEAETAKIKNDWTSAIEAKLWSQLQKAKEIQTRLNSDEGKRFSKVSLPGSPVSRENSTRKSKTLKSRSTFYDHSTAQ